MLSWCSDLLNFWFFFLVIPWCANFRIYFNRRCLRFRFFVNSFIFTARRTNRICKPINKSYKIARLLLWLLLLRLLLFFWLFNSICWFFLLHFDFNNTWISLVLAARILSLEDFQFIILFQLSFFFVQIRKISYRRSVISLRKKIFIGFFDCSNHFCLLKVGIQNTLLFCVLCAENQWV